MRVEMPRAPSGQRGFALVAALFLIVIAAGIAAVLMRTLQSGTAQVDLGVMAQRAHFAAQAGLEWARYRVRTGGACAAGTLALTERGLAGFSVTVQCTETLHGTPPAQQRVFQLQAMSRFGQYGRPGYATQRAAANYSP